MGEIGEAKVMPRIRTIKPDFFKDDELAEKDPLTRLLFAGLWCWCDREGRLRDVPKRLKAEILPYDNCDVDQMLSDLTPKFIRRYQVAERHYIQVLTFKKHQRISGKEAETPSEIPPPQNGEANGVSPLLPQRFTNAQEGKGRERKGSTTVHGPQNGAAKEDQAIKPYTIESPGQEVVAAYKLFKGVEIEDRAWDRLYYPRFKKQAELLLEFLGSPQACIECIGSVKKWAELKRLEWTLETVIKRASDWKNKTLWE